MQPWQFAHTTFDSIRISPAAILIDSRVYGNATHLHESIHLTQSFVGAANELEAYGLNIRSDPRFLILNFPYFADTVTEFFLPEFPKILDRFFARPTRDDLNIPKEVQWYLMPIDDESLEQLKEQMEIVELKRYELTKATQKKRVLEIQKDKENKEYFDEMERLERLEADEIAQNYRRHTII